MTKKVLINPNMAYKLLTKMSVFSPNKVNKISQDDCIKHHYGI